MDRTKRANYLGVSSLVLCCLGAVAIGCSSDPAPAPPPTNPGGIQPPDDQPPVPPPDNADPLPDGADLGGFPSAAKCEGCHEAIYREWTTSMHAHAATSPVTIAQANQVYDKELKFENDPDPQQFCTNCHGPIPAQITGSATFPFQDARFSSTALNEGITCSTCHKYDVNEVPLEGYAGLTEFQNNFNAGPFMFGPYSDPLENSFHKSAQSSLLADDDDSSDLCSSCHQVGIDLNNDGLLRVGQDFVLQNLHQEYLEYRDQGGAETCVSCHMPARTGQAANVTGAPVRQIRSHIFLGVDYPLEEVAQGKDDLGPYRKSLLASAAQLDVENVNFDGDVLNSFDVTIENTGTGHNLPSAFTFMRQMWLEVKVVDPTEQNVVFSSGVLDVQSNDLCDENTILDPSILSTEVVGCDNVQENDRFLVNLQTKLLDKVDLVNGQVVAADGARENWLQLLTGGAVNRIRPIDNTVLAPLKPFETRSFNYPVGGLNVVAGSKIQVRLLFRNLPPYMVRKIGRDQPASELQIRPLAQALQVTEMATREVTLR